VAVVRAFRHRWRIKSVWLAQEAEGASGRLIDQQFKGNSEGSPQRGLSICCSREFRLSGGVFGGSCRHRTSPSSWAPEES